MILPSRYKLGSGRVDVKDLLLADGVLDCDRLIDRTGISSVWHLSEDEDLISLACDSFIELAPHLPNVDEIECLISVTESPRYKFPGNSFELADRFGLKSSMQCIDLNAGCTGFVDALSLAYGLGVKALVVTQESYSRYNHMERSASSILFSDAAAVTLVDPQKIVIEHQGFQRSSESQRDLFVDADGLSFTMNGGNVYGFVLDVVIPQVRLLCEAQDYDVALIHSGSKLVLDAIQQYGLPSDISMPRNLHVNGNLVSASLPALIADFFPDGLSSNTLLAGFGVGLYSNICGLRLR